MTIQRIGSPKIPTEIQMSESSPPRALELPDGYFEMSDEDKRAWARQFLKNLVGSVDSESGEAEQ